MEEIKIQADKDIPLHYHLMKVEVFSEKSKKHRHVKYGYSKFHKGHLRLYSLSKRNSNL